MKTKITGSLGVLYVIYGIILLRLKRRVITNKFVTNFLLHLSLLPCNKYLALHSYIEYLEFLYKTLLI